ncbi:hypothetical protein PNOK_0815800 [Pyrrhoderma noxium]|uniref:Uncharacterized protein n=1 Tax=Pyrrhoderma noxium TaxID=2282107 RepID=A0A286UAD1_9AGAM|nr:hypothetical protein PNOK_0815800 [Pyrrhoderma noxium]
MNSFENGTHSECTPEVDLAPLEAFFFNQPCWTRMYITRFITIALFLGLSSVSALPLIEKNPDLYHDSLVRRDGDHYYSPSGGHNGGNTCGEMRSGICS